MLALLITETVVVLLLVVLVAGLLRSHADILRALHDLGAGVGDPRTSDPDDPTGRRSRRGRDRPPSAAEPVPLQIGPRLPPGRASATAHDIGGITPSGDALAIAVTGVRHLTLVAFLSSGCSSCAGFWRALQNPVASGLPVDIRVVAVTKGPEFESPAEVGRRAAGGVSVVMSNQAWDDYEVPGSPFFVLVDGPAGRRIGEGVANQLPQVADLVRRAAAEAGYAADVRPANGRGRGRGDPGEPAGSREIGLGGIARESSNDAELIAAGILPGDPSLYPTKLEDIFAPAPALAPAPAPAARPDSGLDADPAVAGPAGSSESRPDR